MIVLLLINWLGRINITRLSATSNLSQLAQEIVDKCKLIHPSKLILVEQLLELIRDRQLDEDKRAPAGILSPSHSLTLTHSLAHSLLLSLPFILCLFFSYPIYWKRCSTNEQAIKIRCSPSISPLYCQATWASWGWTLFILLLLIFEFHSKSTEAGSSETNCIIGQTWFLYWKTVRGSRRADQSCYSYSWPCPESCQFGRIGQWWYFFILLPILCYCVMTENLETLIGVLARLLKEEARKDIDLTTVIISIFSCFAAYL